MKYKVMHPKIYRKPTVRKHAQHWLDSGTAKRFSKLGKREGGTACSPRQTTVAHTSLSRLLLELDHNFLLCSVRSRADKTLIVLLRQRHRRAWMSSGPSRSCRWRRLSHRSRRVALSRASLRGRCSISLCYGRLVWQTNVEGYVSTYCICVTPHATLARA